MRDVAVVGLGMHPWGKFPDKTVTGMMRVATEAALKDAGVRWRDIEAVASASSRFSGGKGWGLNGNDIVEEMGSTGVPVYNLSIPGAPTYYVGERGVWVHNCSGWRDAAHHLIPKFIGGTRRGATANLTGEQHRVVHEYVHTRRLGVRL